MEGEVQLRSCANCDAQMPDTAAFCPGCGRPMREEHRARGVVGVLPENIAGGLAYVTFLPGIAFLAAEPYRRNRFVRFHSMQSLMIWVAGVALAIAVKLMGMVLLLIPMLGPLLVLLTDSLVLLAAFLAWVVLVAKALQGEVFKLPVIGSFAEQMADSP